MKRNEGVLNKSVSVKSIVVLVGGTLLTAVLTGLFWHRRDIKRLIEISQM